MSSACNGWAIVEHAKPKDAKTPEEGWQVCGYEYFTKYGGTTAEQYGHPACIFLAQNPTGNVQCGEVGQKSVQWWNNTAPTSFHGEWEQISADVLWIMFNCRGPVDEHGAKLSLKGTYAFKQPADAEHPMPYYVGRDAARRPVKLVPYGTWELRMVEGELLWCPLWRLV
jgi:hypothetical protein